MDVRVYSSLGCRNGGGGAASVPAVFRGATPVVRCEAVFETSVAPLVLTAAWLNGPSRDRSARPASVHGVSGARAAAAIPQGGREAEARAVLRSGQAVPVATWACAAPAATRNPPAEKPNAMTGPPFAAARACRTAAWKSSSMSSRPKSTGKRLGVSIAVWV